MLLERTAGANEDNQMISSIGVIKDAERAGEAGSQCSVAVPVTANSGHFLNENLLKIKYKISTSKFDSQTQKAMVQNPR